jgi:hypothetical protein
MLNNEDILAHLVREMRYIAGISNGQVGRVAKAALERVSILSSENGVKRYGYSAQEQSVVESADGPYVLYEDYKAILEADGHVDTGTQENEDLVTLRPQDFIVGEYPIPRNSGFAQARYGVSVTHIPTGLVEKCHEQRSQHANKHLAFQRLTQRLQDRSTLVGSGVAIGRDPLLTDEVLDDVRKAMGLAPHNTPSNICWNDSYYWNSLEDKYGDFLLAKAKMYLKENK